MAEKEHLISLHLDLARAQIAKAMAYAALGKEAAISAPCLAMEYDYNYMEAKAKAVHHIITARKIRKERKNIWLSILRKSHSRKLSFPTS